MLSALRRGGGSRSQHVLPWVGHVQVDTPLFVRRPCQHLQPPTLLPRPYHRVYTRSRVHGGSAQRGWVERIPLYPTALRAFVFFLSHRPPLFGTSINVCVFYLFILWGSPHSNSTLCQFRGGGCPYNKLKPRDDDVDSEGGGSFMSGHVRFLVRRMSVGCPVPCL